MIRQAISCDICGTEKKQTNHWFVAYEAAGELRVSGWSSRNRLRAGSKHLCGQTCLHKLADDFMARTIAVRAQQPAADELELEIEITATDTSLTAGAAHEPIESSARLVPASPSPMPSTRTQVGLVTMPGRPHLEELAALPAEPPRYASRTRRAEAWERERERELRSAEHRPDIARRRSQA